MSLKVNPTDLYLCNITKSLKNWTEFTRSMMKTASRKSETWNNIFHKSYRLFVDVEGWHFKHSL